MLGAVFDTFRHPLIEGQPILDNHPPTHPAAPTPGTGPAQQPWSQRFESTLHPAIVAFNASIGFDIALLEYDLTGSQAHAQMLAHTGIITAAEAEAIVNGLDQIRQEYRQGQFTPGLETEDVHFAVERRLTALIGDTGKKLHTARSRNDQVGTDLRLYLRDQITQIRHQLRQFQGVLLALAENHVETLIPGYTHLQRAQPLSLAHHLLAYFEMAQRDWQRLGEIYGRVNQSPLGSGALAGTPFPIDRQYTADLLQFDGLYANSLDGVSDRDFAIEFLCAASLIMVHLSRLAEEVILWASKNLDLSPSPIAVPQAPVLCLKRKTPTCPNWFGAKQDGSLATCRACW